MLKLWIVLILALVLVNSHFFLHLIVVISHEVTHFVHDLVLTLCLDRFLVVLQLSCKQIRLRILEGNSLLLSLCLACKAWDLVEVLAAAILDLIGVDKPDIILVISDEFSVHLQDLNLTDLLQVVCYLEALHLTVFLELALLEHPVLIFDFERLIVDLLFCILVIGSVNGCPELDRDRAISLRVCLADSRLNVVDDVLCGESRAFEGFSKLLEVFGRHACH